jgi:acetate kinase
VRGLTGTGYPVADRKLVIAHLGNGCSVTAVGAGKGTACSMGFSTLDGLVMGTRSGRMDPGVLLHLLRSGMSRQELEDLLYRQSGLLGLSGISNDMRDLESAGLPGAEQAIAFFVARLIEEICRMAGVLHGLDAVVFCGGIGENADSIRNRVREGLSFLPGRDGNGVEMIVQQTDEEAELLLAVESFLL